ncbi:signal peptidase I [Massilia timonae]|jgi:signal peptidase I|uniref:Signal peptidase I n=1 Tax=Massilia timonae TaxID=47229 RepID=A0A1S2NEQ0_9BURK|nr:signal peptidase I [Massilia timonae]OIJ43280.1 signal peptidase I [Massilia timonae]
MKNFVRANKGFLMFLLLFGVFRSAVADWSPIPSGSMRPNLLEGDVVLINRLAFDLKIPLTEVSVAHLGEPARGDMVVFYSPHDGTRLIKRVLALPGDLVEMRGDRLFINGEGASYALLGEARERSRGLEVGAIRLEEQVAGTRQRIQVLPGVPAPRSFDPLRIPPGQYLMLGDNRNDSADSRVIGLVPREKLVGRAERILVSAAYQENWMPRLDRFGMSLREDR